MFLNIKNITFNKRKIVFSNSQLSLYKPVGYNMMKKILLINLIVLLFTFNSCQNNDKFDDKYKNQINKNIIDGLNSYNIYQFKGKSIPLKNDFNFFDSLKVYEKSLIDLKLLKGYEKNNYSEFIKTIEFNENPNEILMKIYSSNPFIEHIMDGFGGEITNIFHRNLRDIYEKEGEKFRTNEYISTTDLIIANGYPNNEILKGIAERTDYSNRIERLQLSYYILDNLDCRNDSIMRIK